MSFGSPFQWDFILPFVSYADVEIDMNGKRFSWQVECLLMWIFVMSLHDYWKTNNSCVKFLSVASGCCQIAIHWWEEVAWSNKETWKHLNGLENCFYTIFCSVFHSNLFYNIAVLNYRDAELRELIFQSIGCACYSFFNY